MAQGRREDGDRAGTGRRLSVAEAASELGTTSEGVRSRIKRGTLQAQRESGRVWVIVEGAPPGPGAAPPGDRAEDRADLVDELRARVAFLEQELRDRTEEARRKDHLLAAALERIPALEPPEVPESASEPVATTETPQEPAEQEPHKEESSPPQGQDSSDSTLREGAQQGHFVAPRPRWAQIGVAVLLAGMIHDIPQLIWFFATGAGVFLSRQFVFTILYPLTLLCGLWAGLAWPGRHPKGLAVLGSFAGLITLVINWSMTVIMRIWWPDQWFVAWDRFFLSAIGIAALFTAGGLFGDLIESWRFPRRREQESEVVRGIAQEASGPGRQPSETTFKLVQALGPSILALIGLIIGIIAGPGP